LPKLPVPPVSKIEDLEIMKAQQLNTSYSSGREDERDKHL